MLYCTAEIQEKKEDTMMSETAKYYKYAVLDPRNMPEAAKANDKVFAEAKEERWLGSRVWGIEVTDPALAERCDENMILQHPEIQSLLESDHTITLINLALSAGRPPTGVTLVTVQPNISSVGVMAIFEMGCSAVKWNREIDTRIQLVADAERFARDNWPGVRDLPTVDNLYPEGGHAQELAAIATAVADFKVPLEERVALMEKWITTGEDPPRYREIAEAERMTLIASLTTQDSWVESLAGGKIAIVESTHRAATMVGYLKAPVVIAINPEFRFAGGEPHKKFTICAWHAGYADIRAALNDLEKLELGWGGSPTIGGSPQGTGSELTTKQVVEVVKRHLA